MEQMLLVLIGLLSMFVALILLLILLLICFRRQRLLRSSFNRPSSSCSSSRIHTAKVDDLERPLVSDDTELIWGHNDNLSRNFLAEESSFPSKNVSYLRRQGIDGKQATFLTDLPLKQDGSLVLDIVPDTLESVQVGQTLGYNARILGRYDDVRSIRNKTIDDNVEELSVDASSVIEDKSYKGSRLNLEVISGPALGLNCSRELIHNSPLEVTLGRLPPSDLVIKDSEVSGRHAIIKWSINRSRWELVDMGSLNGTFLNCQAIHHSDSGRRQFSDPVELASGDIITLGTSSRILVKLATSAVRSVPFGVGMASEPMAMRRGGKKLPMEDVSCCQWPLPGVEQFGLFGIFDGHGGSEAAKAASRMLPMIITNMLQNSVKRARVLSLCDSSEVLKDAFLETESAMDYQYEGCTATVLLVWIDSDNQLFAQCANVGDSACVMSVGGQLISMTEDHRVTSLSEQARLREAGRTLKEGESRLCGMNLLRMLGDKFLKEQDSCFSAYPFVSRAVHIDRGKIAFAVMASDGLWDVVSTKKVLHLILKEKERDTARNHSADWIANVVLNEARTLRTKDNTSVIFLDFENKRTGHGYTGS